MIRTMTLAVLVAAVATVARAQTPSSVPLGDEYFAMKAYAEGNVEIAKSRLALERASDADVKKFAEHMIKDHTECNNKIVELARTKGIALPTTIDAVHAATMARMARLSGSDFDKTYMMSQIGAHKEALLLFGHEAHKGEDSDLKALAHKTLPTLESHTKMAFEVAGEKDEYKKFEKVHEYAKQVMEGK
jgi:putative membrane protein